MILNSFSLKNKKTNKEKENESVENPLVLDLFELVSLEMQQILCPVDQTRALLKSVYPTWRGREWSLKWAYTSEDVRTPLGGADILAL